jgi:formylglycine-generating enzyme required for sulfatase activity
MNFLAEPRGKKCEKAPGLLGDPDIAFDEGRADIWKGRGTALVGSYPTDMSPYGVHDMAGNVAEWCGDWFGERYYLESPSKNPGGPASGKSRVIRFGNWFSSHPEVCMCASRDGDNPDRWLNFLGFRVCIAATAP